MKSVLPPNGQNPRPQVAGGFFVLDYYIGNIIKIEVE